MTTQGDPSQRDHVNKSETINDGQWTERKNIPAGMAGVIASRFMSREDIEEYRLVLVSRYRPANPDNIKWRFVQIQDSNDGDAREFMWLTYYDVFPVRDAAGVETIKEREIFRIKQPIPDELRERADKARRDRQRQRRRQAAAASGVPLAGDFYSTTTPFNFGGSSSHVPQKRRAAAQPRAITAGPR